MYIPVRRYIKPTILFILLSPFSISAYSSEIIICNGSYWAYEFKIDGQKCRHAQKVIKDVPSSFKVGHTKKFEEMTALECWESAAKIQIDSAKCCIVESEARTKCNSLNIKY